MKPVTKDEQSKVIELYIQTYGLTHFLSPASKLWRLENLYYIVTKRGEKKLFKLNRAQRDFVENYLMGAKIYHRHIIIKSRQLGFTTLITLWDLDEVMWNPNKSALTIAHTQKDATEIFSRKVLHAVRNLPEIIRSSIDLDQSRASKLQFNHADESVSEISVSNSGRSGTYNLVHFSELSKLFKAYPGKAEEAILGTLPAVPFDGFVFIETTAEGMSDYVYETFMSSWKKKALITPMTSRVEFYPHFYNWTWDDMEMETITDIIKIEDMEKCEIDWAEYQIDNNLTDKEMTYYYMKWLQLNKDIDKLHQEHPSTHTEAFVSSGSTYFSLPKLANFMERAELPSTTYDFINGEFLESEKGDLVIYEQPRDGKKYVIGGDVAEGLEDGDYSVCTVMGYDKQIKAVYRGHIEPDDYTTLIIALGKKFNTAMLAVEFNKDGNWVNTELRNREYENIYFRTEVDDSTKTVSKRFGWLTTKKSREYALGEMKAWFNKQTETFHKPLLEEMMVFVRNKQGRPSAMLKKFDDQVMSTAIAIGVLSGKKDEVIEKKASGWQTLVFTQN